MKDKDENGNLSARQENRKEAKNPEGYPLYSAGEDFYGKYQEDNEVNPDDISEVEASIENVEISTSPVLDSANKVSTNSLDVPGSELDDEQEEIGSEDEENNYYSIGGDSHDDLEEDKDA